MDLRWARERLKDCWILGPRECALERGSEMLRSEVYKRWKLLVITIWYYRVSG